MKKIAVLCAFLLAGHAFAAGRLNEIQMHPNTAPYPTMDYSGWACEASAPAFATQIQFWRDDGVFLGAINADKAGGLGVTAYCSGSPNHVFSDKLYVYPQYLDGKEHGVHAYYVQPNGNQVELSNSPMTVPFSYGPPACPASHDTTSAGIGDGCTTKGFESIPNIGLFRGAFTPACDRHDKCYTTLGTTYGQCDGQFKSDMERACEAASRVGLPSSSSLRESPQSLFDPLGLLPSPPGLPTPPTPPGGPALPPLPPINKDPVKYAACMETARQYHAGVVAYGRVANPLPGLQIGALVRSRNLEQRLNRHECHTTPEASTLYSSTLIAKVKSVMHGYGKLPTTENVFHVINQGGYDWGNIVTNYAGWEARLPLFVSQLPVQATIPVKPGRGPITF